jgi:DNA-binding FadR family transcriptional regulator
MVQANMQPPLRRPVLNQLIQDYVKRYILDNELSASDPLPSEIQLAQELGVGRGSVREAIKALQSLGIVEVRHGDGLYVSPFTLDPMLEILSYGMRFDATTLAELAQIRVWLERAAIERAVHQIGPQDLARLEALMGTWREKAAAGEPAPDLDQEFHRIIVGTLNNQTLMKFFEVFWIASGKLDDLLIQDARSPEGDFQVHQAILNAVKTGDSRLAQQHMTRHFSRLQEHIRQTTGGK